jgi:hypothetical protein
MSSPSNTTRVSINTPPSYGNGSIPGAIEPGAIEMEEKRQLIPSNDCKLDSLIKRVKKIMLGLAVISCAFYVGSFSSFCYFKNRSFNSSGDSNLNENISSFFFGIAVTTLLYSLSTIGFYRCFKRYE